MSIRDSDVQRVRDATDIVALVSRRVSLKRVGSRHVGLCPFHTEKTPSFSVNGAAGFYHCFGCKASGDAITFVRETEHLDFAEAVEQLAAAANITLTYESAGAQRAGQRRKELMDLLEAAARWYHDLLMSSPEAGEARAYLRRRGYDRDTVVSWRLGYAPPRRDALCGHLGAEPAQLAAAGLARTEASGSGDAPTASDFFRDRIMFPICDASGRVVSFAGRLLPRRGEPPPEGPKYKNTAGTDVYDKSRVLYGLHRAKQAARTAKRIVVCEGYTDVIGCELAGIAEAVATCGTALTRQHAELLSRSASRIVLAFDADAAGQTATERVHQWERALGLDVFVAALPPGSDPGDLAASNPPALRRALDEAQPLHAFRAERILDRADLGSPSGRDRAADEAAGVLAVYPAEVVLSRDLEPIAARIPMNVESFRERVDAARQLASERADADAGLSPGYGGAPPPPDPGDDYLDAFDPGCRGDDEFDEPPPRVRARRPAPERSAAAREQALLEAVASAKGDAPALVVPELFTMPAYRDAYLRMTSEPGWRDRLNSDVPDRELLAQAAAGAAELRDGEALDRAVTALRRHVQATIQAIRDGGGVPGVASDADPAAAESLRFRHDLLVWLRERNAELLDSESRVAGAQAIVEWIRAV